jgi:hypothetical protein
MWPFRRRTAPRVESVRLAEVATTESDYPVLTVGQSRLGESFAALGFGTESEPRFALATLVPVIDPGMKKVADLEIRVDGRVVGYLRPPALDVAIALLESHRAESLEVPVVLLSTPAGPEVRVHVCLTEPPLHAG